MSKVRLVIDFDTKPASLPSLDEIIQKSQEAPNSDKRTFPLFDEVSGVACAFVKRGRSIKMGEAFMQDLVTKTFNDKPDAALRAPLIYLAFEYLGIGFIVMEHIEGLICTDADVELVAAAVNSLINIKGSTLEPGPIGGGNIPHPFFMDWESSIEYKSVKDLENHINGVGVPFKLALYPCTFLGFLMTSLGIDFDMYGTQRACRLGNRGQDLWPAPLPIRFESEQLHEG